jgi:hypothetical protein
MSGEIPRGRTGEAGSTKIVTVRLDSFQQHEAIYNASRDRDISINSFCLTAILNAAAIPGTLDEAVKRRLADLAVSRPAQPIVKNPKTKEEISQTVLDATKRSSDPFDLITLKQLERIARESGVPEACAFRIVQMFMEAVG